MKRNSVIMENLIQKLATEKFKCSEEYNRLAEISSKTEREFLEIIGNNKELKDKYFELDKAMGETFLEAEDGLCCECIRLGFMLCLDILGFEQK